MLFSTRFLCSLKQTNVPTDPTFLTTELRLLNPIFVFNFSLINRTVIFSRTRKKTDRYNVKVSK